MRVARAVKTDELVALNTITVSYKVGKRKYDREINAPNPWEIRTQQQYVG